MSRQISGYINQNQPYNIYSSGECNCEKCSRDPESGVCKPDDWTLGMSQCCNGQCKSTYQCSKVNPATCPKIGQQKAISAKFSSPPTVQCDYSLDSIKTDQDIYDWVQYFGNDETLQEIVLPHYSSKYPITPVSVIWRQTKNIPLPTTVVPPLRISMNNDIQPVTEVSTNRGRNFLFLILLIILIAFIYFSYRRYQQNRK